jgi:CheY-like chemotaxis protein
MGRDGKMKVLVVDDDESFASTIQMMLEMEGLEVVSAKDGIEGYSAYLRFEPDLIITDIQMPGKNGLEMMGEIRTHNPMIKTIYMSGDIRAFNQHLEEEERRYPVTCFKKPFALNSLMELLSESLGNFDIQQFPVGALNNHPSPPAISSFPQVERLHTS